jgi:nitroreductase
MSLQRLSLRDAFKWRHSVRSFSGGDLTPPLLDVLKNAIEKGNTFPTPFSARSELRLALPGISSFGSVQRQTGWIFPVVPLDTPKSELVRASVDAAVRGQIAVMDLSRHQIGTIWLLGYGHSKANKLFNGFQTVAGIPYGIGETANLSLVARMAKFLSQSRTRKPIETLFWDVEKGRAYNEETARDLLPFFEALRSGPSAINGQPWRFAVEGSKIHVYSKKRLAAAAVDIGIAIGNIEVWAIENNHPPAFSVVSPAPPDRLGGSYVCSVSFRD